MYSATYRLNKELNSNIAVKKVGNIERSAQRALKYLK